jgi:hypothetical protein
VLLGPRHVIDLLGDAARAVAPDEVEEVGTVQRLRAVDEFEVEAHVGDATNVADAEARGDLLHPRAHMNGI